MNISSIIKWNTDFSPGYRAIICGDDGRQFTWQEFDRLVNKTGNGLIKLGVKKGDRVGIYLPNSPEYLIAYFAIARIGAVATPFNIIYKTGESVYILNNSRAKVLIGASGQVKENIMEVAGEIPHLEKIITVGEPVEGTINFYDFINEQPIELDIEDCREDDPVTLLYTSGTTGKPKGAVLTHGNFLANAALNGNDVLHVNDQDLFLTATPYCHVFFVLTVLGPFYAGAGVVSMQRFAPDKTLELISNYRITHFAGVPTMYFLMLEHYDAEKYDLGAWRYAQSAAASMPGDYIDKIEYTFGVSFCECYGSTETSSTATYGRVGHGKPGSIGPVARGFSLIIADDSGNPLPVGEVGEILVKGQGIFKGYWELPEATQEAFKQGWFCTGDMGRYDEDGYLYIVDRKKDMIISGGYNIYPREVEEILYQNPKIMEAAVVGIQDTYKGETVKAFIAVKEGQNLSEDEIVQFCKERMAPYKVPRVVKFMDELPKNATGKILKRKLTE